MSRLADYFVVVGYDHEKERSGVSCGKTLQRFPENDWDDCPYTQGVELFCQPAGWQLSTQRLQPTFFAAVLTDIDADRHYCACMTFNEAVAMTPTKPDDEEEEQDGSGLVHHSLMFAPKTILLVSRMNNFEALKNCLGIIYTVFIENLQYSLETIIGNILGCVHVPPSGGPQVRFSIGGGDRQALQPPLSNTIPVTNSSVALLFSQFGIKNVVSLFTAVLTDHKVLFLSQSYTRLTDACHGLTALLYPLRYSYVYIPILPISLLEVLNTPTPFLAGIHSSICPERSDLLDVIVADLDGGNIIVPECISLPCMMDQLFNRTLKALTMIIKPELLTADDAFPAPPKKPKPMDRKDKEIRAVFIRLFAELFTGYRSCLTLIRIHPEPFITFHKAYFLGQRAMVDDEFACRVLDCMSFSTFVAERGPPYRVCDIFDEVYATMQDQLKEERSSTNDEKMMAHIKEIAQQLYLNENPNSQPYVPKFPKPTEGAYSRIHQMPFPKLDGSIILNIIQEGVAKHNLNNKLLNVRPHQPRIVPMGPPISSVVDKQKVVDNNARRLEVLRNCINFIFENKISDARKIFPAVLRALNNKVARLALTQELSYHIQSNRAMLEHQQFDLVVRLLNCALQNDSSMDENGVAYAILPLATSFCRKLCTGVIQFAYTCVQEHAVWRNNQFWEASFYLDVQKEIRQLYLPHYEEHFVAENTREEAKNSSYGRDSSLDPSRSKSCTPDTHRRSAPSLFRPKEIGALDIAAEQLRIWPNLSKEQQEEMVNNEESTVYSQAIHYANRMVYMMIPLDVNRRDKNTVGFDEKCASNSNITASLAESDSLDAESGFDESEASDVGANAIRFVTRFVDKVCSESSVTQEHLKSLHQMIPGVVAMHIETLESIHRESKRLPPIQKPKILEPTILPGEEIVMEGLRVYLLPDGREEGVGGSLGGPCLLPAEGAIFLTTYRIIFKGIPCDPLACEQIVVRCFPVSTLTREKRISVQYLQHLDQWLHEGLQLRSNIFQLMKIVFDEEVSSDDVETLRKLLHKMRNPARVFDTFTFNQHPYSSTLQPTPLHKSKEKSSTLKAEVMENSSVDFRQLAKKTLMKTVRRAGLKPKQSSRKQKYMLPTPPTSRRTLSPRSSDSESERPSSEIYDELSSTNYSDGSPSVIDEAEYSMQWSADAKSLEKLMERPGYQDYVRLGIGSLPNSGSRTRNDQFRITDVNSNYSVCRSYPALLIVPHSVTDESIRKFSRCYRQSRFPIITWRHSRTKALLLRGSGFHSRSLMGMLRHHNTVTGTSSGETSSSIEQENYFRSLVAVTPNSMRSYQSSYSDSLTSLDSLMMVGSNEITIPETPEPLRKSTFNRTAGLSNTRASGGAKSKKMSSSALDISSPASQLTSSQTVIAAGNIASSATLSASPSSQSAETKLSSVSSSGTAQRKSMITRASSTILTPTINGTPFLSFPRRRRRSGYWQWARTAHHISFRTALGRIGSFREKPKLQTGSLESNRTLRQNGSLDPKGDIVNSSVQGLHKVSLHILGEKAQMKGIKVDSFRQCDFIPVDFFEVRHIKASFKKLMKACVPSAPPSSPEHTLYKGVEDSEWLLQVQNVMQLAGAVVDLLDVQGSSVIICLEDGWDVTTQIVSVAQILLDPYYRTLEGFKALIEKEWLSCGHRFTHRSNQTAANQASGFAAIFLQFLDIVHQIHRQFPLSFEYNQYFLKFMAYHYVSNRFRTFMMDTEFERMEAGWLLEEKKAPKVDGPDEESGFSPKHSSTPVIGLSIWDYIEKHHRRSTVFFNFMYSPSDYDVVLRPYSNLQNLVIWNYFLNEDLAHGPSYDIEIMGREMRPNDNEQDADLTPHRRRKIINGCYDNILVQEPNFFSWEFQEIHRLETELGHLPQKWKVLWDKLEQPTRESLHRQTSFNTQLVRLHGRSIHKRSTLEILLKGKLLGETAKMFSQQHRFEKQSYTTPAYCDYCSHVLWGLVKTGDGKSLFPGMHCVNCGYNCHEKCMPHVPKNCKRLKAVPDTSASSSSISKTGGSEASSVSGGEHRTHEGYLYKRGALLKGWKQRWFVLDSMKHQLRYYDAMEDSSCKGYIDLGEVVSVQPIKNVQGAPKKSDENGCFELRTMRRVYNFLDTDAKSAQEWIDKIQSCIQ
ncbi:myotubularin-related protein 13 isoform X6 [Octopus bimaculoides]|uniref:myotubularin-related protein 13 isoform X6 n=1 Tax=Octopus bimaculoides TaxID=37653 RepID=UPI0022E91A10|nr:myotubularin-related protein 13 isoform X6 [Octopus bimaculoides]